MSLLSSYKPKTVSDFAVYLGDVVSVITNSGANSGSAPTTLQSNTYLMTGMFHGSNVAIELYNAGYAFLASQNSAGFTTATNYNDLIYANGLYVAAGSAGVLNTSTDAANWTVRSSGTTSGILSLSFGNGTYVLTGNTGLIRSSTNAVNWTSRTFGSNNTSRASEYAFSQYVIGVTSTIFTSTNLTNWTNRTSGTYEVYKLRSVNSILIAGCDQARIRTSTNGANWSLINTGTSTNAIIRDFDYSPTQGRYAFCTDAGSIFTSTNLANFAVTSTGTINDLYGIHWLNDRWYVSGQLSSTAYLASSTNLINFTRVKTNYLNTTNGIYFGMAFGPNVIALATNTVTGIEYIRTDSHYIPSQNNTYMSVNYTVPLQTSANISTYIKATENGLWDHPTGAIVSSRIIPAASDSQYLYANAVYSQSSYTSLYGQIGKVGAYRMEPVTQPTTSLIRCFTFGNSLYVMGGGLGGGGGPFIRTSTDAFNWTSTAGFNNFQFNTVVFGSSLYVAGGSGGAGDNLLYSSTNAVNWTARTTVSQSGIRSIIYNGSNLYVYGGSGGVLATSTNGINWTARTSGTRNPIYGLTNNGTSLYVYAGWGSTGGIATSTNAINWTARTTGITGQHYSVTFANSTYVVGHDDGSISTSTNAVNWTNRTTGNSNAVQGIAYGNGFWVFGVTGATSNPVLMTSTNLTNFVNINLPSSATEFNGIAFVNNRFLFGGIDGLMYTTTDFNNYGVMKYSSLYDATTEFYIPDIQDNSYNWDSGFKNTMYIKG